MSKKSDYKIEFEINKFLISSFDELVNDYSLKDFKKMINLLPPSFIFINMVNSMLYDMEEVEAYEKCQILYDWLKSNEIIEEQQEEV